MKIKQKLYLFLLGIAVGIAFIFSGVWINLAIPAVLFFILWVYKKNAGVK